jgi:hypothetical protein
MIKVKVIGKDNVGWSIDKDRSNLLSFLSKIPEVKITNSCVDADIYFFVWLDLVRSPRYFFIRLIKLFSKKKIIAWVTNDITQSEKFLKVKWFADLFISPSDRVSLFLEKNNFKFVQIPFYVSEDVYKNLSQSRQELSKKLEIDFDLIRDKFLIGSFQRDSLGGDLNKPKWQKDPDLLISICESLPKEKYALVLAGPRRHYLISKCKEKNIPYVFIGDESFIENKKDDIFVNNLDEQKINILYNLIDLYLVTSKSEGGPKAVMEASLAKTMIFSTDVGLAPDFLHPDLIYSNDSKAKILEVVAGNIPLEKIRNYIDFNYNKASNILNIDHYQDLVRKAILL